MVPLSTTRQAKEAEAKQAAAAGGGGLSAALAAATSKGSELQRQMAGGKLPTVSTSSAALWQRAVPWPCVTTAPRPPAWGLLGLRPEWLGSSARPQWPASGRPKVEWPTSARPKVEDFSLATGRQRARVHRQALRRDEGGAAG